MKRVLSIVLTLALLLGMVPGTVTAKAEASTEEVTQWTADSVHLWDLNSYLEDRVDWLDIHFAYDAEFLNYQMTFRLQDDYPGAYDEEWEWYPGRVPADVYESMLFSLFAVDEALLQALQNETEYDAESDTYALTYPIGAGGFGQSCFYRGYVANDGVIEVYSEEVSFISLGTQFESWEAYDAFLLETVGYITDDLWMADDLPESIEYNGKVYNLGYQEDNAGYFYEVNTGHGNLYRFDFANGSLRLLGEDTFAVGEMPETFADDSAGVTLSGEGVLCNALSEESESWSAAAEAMRDMSERFAAYSIQQKLSCPLPEYGWGPTYMREATFQIPLPENFTGGVDAYLLTEQGTLESLAITVDSESRIAEVVTDEWGTLILADQDAAVIPEPGGDGPVVEDGPVWVGSCGDNLTWELTGGGTLYIHGTGEMYGYDWISNLAPWYDYRESIYHLVIEDGATSIGRDAFYNCTVLETAQIPDSICHIGEYAFSRCESLRTIVIPAAVESIDLGSFEYCSLDRIYIRSEQVAAQLLSNDDAFIWQNAQYLCFDSSMSYDAEAYSWALPCVTEEICDGVTYMVYGWHVMGELVSQVEATCTEDGYTIYRCAVCAQEYVQDVITAEHTRGERVFENEISDETGYVMEWDFAYYCTVCGLELERTHMLAPAANGRDIWFYYPGGDLYITGTADGTRLLGSNLSADAAIFTAWRTEDGVYTFVYDGKYLTSGASGNQLYLADEESECSRWVFEQAENGWFVRNLGAFYGTKPQYLEYYRGFTTYGLGNNRTPFIFQFGYADDLPQSPEPTDQVTITFDANGGEGVPESITASFGETVVLPSFVPERFGYTFLGWSEDPNAVEATYWPGSDNLDAGYDMTLYAVWVAPDELGGEGGGCSRYMDFEGQCHYYSFTAAWSDDYTIALWGAEGTKCTVYTQDGEVLLVLEEGGTVWLDCNSGQTYVLKVEYTGVGREMIGVEVGYAPPTGGDDWWSIPGDVDENGVVDTDDAIYLLYYTLFGDELYPVWCNCDLNSDGVEDTDDAIYLLYHTLFGEELYPLYP